MPPETPLMKGRRLHKFPSILNLAFLSVLQNDFLLIPSEIRVPSLLDEFRASCVISRSTTTHLELSTTKSFTSSIPSFPVPKSQRVKLDSGTVAEVISCVPVQKRKPGSLLASLLRTQNKREQYLNTKPILAFLHGSFHASWCWAEHYMPYFASIGYPCVALSLQGTGGTPALPQGVTKVKIASHVNDLDAFLRFLSNNCDNDLGMDFGENPCIALIGHSFGGLVIMKWLEKFYTDDLNEKSINLASIGLLCSVPPSGNGPMTMRFLSRSLIKSWKITAGFAMRKAINDKNLCRDLFFGGDDADSKISDYDLERYQSYFARDTVATIDLTDLVTKLPSITSDKKSGRASYVKDLQRLAIKPLVLGASDDYVVDIEGVRETAKFLGLDYTDVVLVESPHDIMLGRKWTHGAEAILNWIMSYKSTYCA